MVIFGIWKLLKCLTQLILWLFAEYLVGGQGYVGLSCLCKCLCTCGRVYQGWERSRDVIPFHLAREASVPQLDLGLDSNSLNKCIS